MWLILTILAVLVVLVGSEVWWRRKNLHGEFTRKFVHITVGSFVAFWPYYLSSFEIKLLSLAFIAVVILSKYLHVFQAIHSVQRPTSGELWFALVVGLLAFTLNHPHIYTTAILTMAVADGLAAVIGIRYGTSRRYSVMGAPKSVIGTLTFFVVALAILVGYDVTTPATSVGLLVVPIAAVATVLENVAVRGLDNLLVPLWVGGVLLALL